MRLALPFVRVVLVIALSLSTHGLPVLDVEKKYVNYTSSSSYISTQHGYPEKIPVGQCADGLTTGKHIITVKDGLPRTQILAMVTSDVIELDYINTIVGYFDDQSLERIQARSDVSYITEECFLDSNMSTASVIQTQTQPNAPWGLARLSSMKRLSFTPVTRTQLSYSYYSGGTCADVYIVDSGINIHHLAFQGRAFWGATFGNHGTDNDELGHGTHIAGIVGSSHYGVAKGTRLIGVKVLGRTTKIVMGDLHRGLEWIYHHSQTTNRPSVVNLSLSADANYPPLDLAVEALVKIGIHVVVSAGSLNKDVLNSSPSHLSSVITVGSSTIDDARASESNYGDVVDLFAPGTKIMSTFVGSRTATSVRSGSSMAAPHVAGLVACFICLEARPPTPAEMKKKIVGYALNGVLSNIPYGTPNRLAHIPAMFWPRYTAA